MTLQQQALEAYKNYGAQRLERLKDPQVTLDALEQELGLKNPVLHRDENGIIMAESEGMYFHFVEDKLHILLEQPGQKPNWNPFEGLIGLGRLVMMRDQEKFSFAVPPNLRSL